MGTPLGPKYVPHTYMDPLFVINALQKSCFAILVYGGLRGRNAEPEGFSVGPLGFRVFRV